MKRSIRVAGIVTLATFIICYAGICQELRIAKQTPRLPVRLAQVSGSRDDPASGSN